MKKAYVEITNVCNLSCDFCPPTARRPSFMTKEDFSSILGKLSGAVKRIYLHVKGEPLLHPDLERLLEIAEAGGFEVFITTNGSLLGEKAEALLGAAALRKLSVSLHSHADGREIKRYWEGIEGFLDKHRKTPRFPVSLRLWNMKEGRLPPEAEGLWERLRERYPRLGPWDSPEAWPVDNRLDEALYLNDAEVFEWPDPRLPRGGEKGSCLGLRDQIGILVDGSLVPCCLDGEGRMVLGNLLGEELDAILAGPRAVEMRRGFERGVLVEELCRTCGFRRRFDS